MKNYLKSNHYHTAKHALSGGVRMAMGHRTNGSTQDFHSCV